MLIHGAIVAAFTAVIVAAPLLLFFAREPQWLTARANIIVNPGEQPSATFFLNNGWLVARSLVHGGSVSPLDNLPGRPLLDPLQIVGFGVGALWVVIHARRSSAARKLLIWLPVMAAPTILTEGAPSFERMVNAMPAIAAVVAIGWVTVWQLIQQRITPASTSVIRVVKHLASAGLASATAVSIALNVYAVLALYPNAPTLRQDFTAGITELMRTLVARSGGESVFAQQLNDNGNTPHQDFFLPGTPVRYLDFRQCLPLTHNRGTRTTYLVNSGGDGDSTRRLIQLYPQAAVTPFASESSWLVQDLTLIEVPAQTPVNADMVERHAEFAPGMTLLGYSLQSDGVQPGGSLFVTLYWQVERDVTTDYTAFMHVDSGKADSPVLAQRDGQPCQALYPTSRWRAGDLVPDSFAVTIPPDAPPGTYPLLIGWYALPSLERQMLTDADKALANNRAWITDITIR